MSLPARVAETRHILDIRPEDPASDLGHWIPLSFCQFSESLPNLSRLLHLGACKGTCPVCTVLGKVPPALEVMAPASRTCSEVQKAIVKV